MRNRGWFAGWAAWVGVWADRVERSIDASRDRTYPQICSERKEAAPAVFAASSRGMAGLPVFEKSGSDSSIQLVFFVHGGLGSSADSFQSAKALAAVMQRLRDAQAVGSRIDYPVALVHGDEDRLIPLQNTRYAFLLRNRQHVAFCCLESFLGGGSEIC